MGCSLIITLISEEEKHFLSIKIGPTERTKLWKGKGEDFE